MTTAAAHGNTRNGSKARRAPFRRLVAATAVVLSAGICGAQVQNDQIGFSPNHVFDGMLQGENVDVMTGNLNLRIPIGPRYELNRDLSYQVELYYNSKIWEHECDIFNQAECPGELIAPDSYGLGFQIFFGRVYHHPKDKPEVYRFQTADGGEHFFTTSDLGFVKDASPIRVSPTANGWKAELGNGTRVHLEHYVGSGLWPYGDGRADAGWYATRIETTAVDAYGDPQHYVDIFYNSGNQIASIVDSAGRTTTFNYDIRLSPTISVPAFHGSESPQAATTATYRLLLETRTVHDPSATPAPDVQRDFLVGIQLPILDTDESHSFDYGFYGLLTDWTLPTGAATRYYHKYYSSGRRRPYHSEMLMKELYIGDAEPFRWSYTRFGDGVIRDSSDIPVYQDGTTYSASNPRAVRVLDPFGNLTVYWFERTVYDDDTCNYCGECRNYWDDGLLTRIDQYAGPAEDGSRLVRRQSYDYAYSGMFQYRTPVCDGLDRYKVAVQGRVATAETITLAGGDTPAMNHRVEYSDWYWGGDGAFTVPKTTDEYVDGELYRTTYTEYDRPQIRGRHRYVEVRDADGDVISRTDKYFTADGRLECEAARAGSVFQGSLMSCAELTLGAGDVATLWTFDATTGQVSSKTVRGGDDGESHTTAYVHAGGDLPFLKSKHYADFAWKAVDRDVDFNSGLPFTSRAPDGAATAYSWDALGRLTQITPAAPEAPVVVDYYGLERTEVTQSATPDNHTATAYVYDELGRVIEEQRRNLDGTWDFRKTEYDIAGRILRQSGWAAAGTADTELPWTEYDYEYRDSGYVDPLGRVWRTTYADGSTVANYYLGRTTSVTRDGIAGVDGDLVSTTVYTNDTLGRLVSVESPDEGADAVYSYDDRDNLIEVQLIASPEIPGEPLRLQSRHFAYDQLGRLRVAANPESGTTEYMTYDARGNLLEYKDAKLNNFMNTYDAAGRLVRKAVNTGSGLKTVQSNSYSATTGNLVAVQSYADAGVLVSEKSLTYGPLSSPALLFESVEGNIYAGLNGRLLSVSTKIVPWADPLVATYGYDALGVQAQVNYPDPADAFRVESNVRYMHHNGFLWEVHDDTSQHNVEYVSDITYDPSGAVTTYVRGNDLIDRVVLDEMDRPATMEVLRWVEVPSDPASSDDCGSDTDRIVDLEECRDGPDSDPDPNPGPVLTPIWGSGSYQYDLAGNIKAIGADQFRYDGLNRLVLAQVAHLGVDQTVSYEYDPFGNMLRRAKQVSGDATPDVRDYVVRWQSNRLQSQLHTSIAGTSTIEYGFDATGNMNSAGGRGYSFDSQGRLVRVTDSQDGLVARYDYDASGHRVRSAVGDVETFFFRDEGGRVLSEFRRQVSDTADPAWDKDYVYVHGKALVLLKNDMPAAPAKPWADPVSAESVTVHWGDLLEPDLYHYFVTRTYKASDRSMEVATEFELPPDQLAMTDSFSSGEVTATTLLKYTVQALDEAANLGDPSPELLVRPLGDGPPVPTNLAAFPTDRAVRLTWDAVDDDDLWGYRVERLDAEWVTVTPMPIPYTEYFDAGLVNGQCYTYRVSAVDTSGRASDPSNTVATTPYDNVAPVRPMGLTARPGRAARTLELDWQEVLDADLAGYALYRRIPLGTFVQVGSDLPVTDTEHPTAFTDSAATGVESGQEYCYMLEAVDGNGNHSESSAEVCARPRHHAIGVPSMLSAEFEVDDMGTTSTDGVNNSDGCNYIEENDDVIQVRVTWEPVAADRYRVYRAKTGEDEFVVVSEPGPCPSTCEYIDRAPDHYDLTYYVVALSTINDLEEESGAVTADTEEINRAIDEFDEDVSVRNLQAIDGDSLGYYTFNSQSRAVKLFWSRVPESQLIGYHVYRRADWSHVEIGYPLSIVPQTEFQADSWVRLTNQPMSDRYFEDMTVGGMDGAYQYAVRPVFRGNVEGHISKVLSVNLFWDNSGRHCDSDHVTHDVTLGLQWMAWIVPTTTEIQRVNAMTKGTGARDGSPTPPILVTSFFGCMPQGEAINFTWCLEPHHEITCFGYVPGMRSSRYAAVFWYYAYYDYENDQLIGVDPPSDLAGFHVEMAGSPEGPWRRVTKNLVAWWERFYNIQNVGVEKYVAPGDCRTHEDFSGHNECLSFRVIAVDEYGNEAEPVYSMWNPQSGDCPMTPPAPQDLRASTWGGECDAECCTLLEWDPAPGAVEYHIYRHIFPGGLFFYDTQVQPASAGTAYVESGDGDYNEPDDVDPNHDCPTAPDYHNRYYDWGAVPTDPTSYCDSCGMGFLEAYYVTARGATGGESPRSNIVFWHCNDDPGYVRNGGPTGESEWFARLAAPAVNPVVGLLPHDAMGLRPPSGPRVLQESDFGECRLGNVVGLAAVDAGRHPKDTSTPLVAGMLTLGSDSSSHNPPFQILDLHLDHLGSTRLVTNQSGGVVSEHKFLPFGDEILPMIDYTTKMFTGHERDRETGLDYMLARYYDDDLPRLMSPDPVLDVKRNLFLPQRWNRYTYVLNNPLNLWDPDGLQERPPSQTDNAINTAWKAIKKAFRVRAPHGFDEAVRAAGPMAKELAITVAENIRREAIQEAADTGDPHAETVYKEMDDLLTGKADTDEGVAEIIKYIYEKSGEKKDEEKEKTDDEEPDKEKDGGDDKKNSYGIDPDGPYGPTPHPCQGMGPMCR